VSIHPDSFTLHCKTLAEGNLDLGQPLFQQVVHREEKETRDFSGIEMKRVRVFQSSHPRVDQDIASGSHRFQITKNLDLGRLQADFLFGLSKRRSQEITIVGFPITSGKADLTLMGLNILGALSQQNLLPGSLAIPTQDRQN